MIRITLRQLAYFEAVERRRDVRKAAEELAISEAALGLQIKDLETQLLLTLVDQEAKPVRVTDIGLDIANRARAVLGGVRDIEALSVSQNPVLSGRFRLGVIPTIGPYILPDLLPALHDQYPSLDLDVRETRTANLLEELSHGTLDALLLALPVSGKDLKTIPLFEDPYVLARQAGKAADNPFASGFDEGEGGDGIEAGAIDPQGLILLEEGHCLHDQALSFCGGTPADRSRGLGASSLSTVIQMVANGYGETLLPQMAVAVETRNPAIEVQQFKNPAPTRQIGLAYRTATARERDIEALAKVVREVGGERGEAGESVLVGNDAEDATPAPGTDQAEGRLGSLPQ